MHSGIISKFPGRKRRPTDIPSSSPIRKDLWPIICHKGKDSGRPFLGLFSWWLVFDCALNSNLIARRTRDGSTFLTPFCLSFSSFYSTLMLPGAKKLVRQKPRFFEKPRDDRKKPLSRDTIFIHSSLGIRMSFLPSPRRAQFIRHSSRRVSALINS